MLHAVCSIEKLGMGMGLGTRLLTFACRLWNQLWLLLTLAIIIIKGPFHCQSIHAGHDQMWQGVRTLTFVCFLAELTDLYISS